MKRIASLIIMLCVFCISNAANYLTFTAEEDGSTFGILNKNNNPDVQYSLDGGETWTALAAGDTITLVHKGDKALLRGNNPEGFSKRSNKYSSFTMTGKIAASGSVMSLIDGTGETLVVPADYCFYSLFSGCTSLTQAPELPATTLAESCYRYMFEGCTSLTQAPELPATTLADYCYQYMFSGCTSLTQAPELPATTLAESCYNGMFWGCTSLTQAPELPATTLAEACYYDMFRNCTSLTQAPALPATTLPTVSNVKGGCYLFMFSGCTSLSRIRVSFDDWNDGLHTLEWVKDVAPAGTFICPKTLALEYGIRRIPEGWTVQYIDDTVAVVSNYLTFTAEEDGSTFGIAYNYLTPDVQYSLNGGETWTELAVGDTILLAKKGDKAHIRGYNEGGLGSNGKDDVHFVMTGAIAASGSVMSLIDGSGSSTEIPCSYCFIELFSGCTSLTQAPALPVTTLAFRCYDGMFSGCTSLTQAPELPATTLADFCYYEMFKGCTRLTQAPELPATTLANCCYNFMFSGCTNLSEIRVAFVEWKKEDNTHFWVENVAPTGTFYCPKALPLEYGLDRIPEGWTVKYIEEGTGVNDAVSSEIAVWTEGNTIYIRDSEGDVEVYDMLGRLIVSKRNGQENIQISVPQKGIYVVKVGTETHKVVL
ncbi:MAG: leucine-rich repeat protein [Bacteroidales bacterium]|nr:leucine-rich repeat protein [Bacteroidales bacterium]